MVFMCVVWGVGVYVCCVVCVCVCGVYVSVCGVYVFGVEVSVVCVC